MRLVCLNPNSMQKESSVRNFPVKVRGFYKENYGGDMDHTYAKLLTLICCFFSYIY